ncbi:ankyrin repeat and LEM domain-containing protein 2 isoform X2 [Tachypleus tridentatus]|uniref:ankyrin repeat and LEM domain-containing protein 2 isoform X2 n=1 Tax=Tachypleus tridentatus TaxID=6853 RepID=UPI003FCFFE56
MRDFVMMESKDPASLSDQELRIQLEKYGETVGPVTDSTRGVFECLLNRIRNKEHLSSNGCQSSLDEQYSHCSIECSTEENNPSRKSDSLHYIYEQNGHLKNVSINAYEKLSSSEETSGEDSSSPSSFYGVSLPPGTSCSDELPLVFSDKREALQTVKKYRGARFKVFSCREDAVAFSMVTSEQLLSSPATRCIFSPSSPCAESVDSDNNSGNGEKPSPFKAPKSQEMVKLRKAVEAGDAEYFRQCVWTNPRFLISSGDTPAIVQEGFRYNVLHVAAKSKQGTMCQLILSTIEDQKFMKLLYSDDSEDIRQQRIIFLIDLYLNTPDRGMCETPLHFACKFGCLKAAEVLATHPSCDLKRLNKYGQTAREIICDRCLGAPTEVKKQIENLFEMRYFVPVLRSKDNSIQPVIGEPWSPDHSTDDVSPLSSPSSPKDPVLNVKAYAGPMSPTQAELFYKKWKTPPLLRGDNMDMKVLQKIRLTDPEKGLERVGRDLAKHMKVMWSEYWLFLDSWCDLSSQEGLKKLEDHLKKIYRQVVNEINTGKSDDICVTPNVNIRQLSPQFQETSSPDESECLNSSKNTDDSLSPISKLCQTLQKFHMNSPKSCVTSPDTPSLFSRSPIHNSSENDEMQDLSDVTKTLQFDTSDHHHQKGKVIHQFQEERCDKKVEKEEGDLDPNAEVALFTLCDDGIHEEQEWYLLSMCNIIAERLSLCVSDLLSVSQELYTSSFWLEQFIVDRMLTDVAGLLSAVSSTSNTFSQKYLSTLHPLISKKTHDIMKSNLLDHEVTIVASILKTCWNCQPDFSSSDDENLGVLYSHRCRKNKRNNTVTSKKHVRCILNILKGDLSREHGSRKCVCEWFLVSSFSDTNKTTSLDGLQQLISKSSRKEKHIKTSTTAFNFAVNDLPEGKHKGVEVTDHLLNMESKNSLDLPSDNYTENCFAENDESGDEEVFFTPPSSYHSTRSSSPAELVTPEEAIEVYIEGCMPSKLDLDVLHALEEADIDPLLYPYISQWKHLVCSFSRDIVESWPSPTNPRYGRWKTIFSPVVSTPHSAIVNSNSKRRYMQNSPTSLTPSKQLTVPNQHARNTAAIIAQPRNLYESFLGWEEMSGD